MSDTRPASHAPRDPAAAPAPAGTGTGTDPGAASPELAEAVGYVLGDCFFAVGQAIGMRMTVDYDAVVWWHDHFRMKFLAGDASSRKPMVAGPRERDRGWLDAGRTCSALFRRAGTRSTSRPPVVLLLMSKRYCEIRSKRAAPVGDHDAETVSRLAGYWCVGTPY